jgi:fatty acid synthase subunit alpha
MVDDEGRVKDLLGNINKALQVIHWHDSLNANMVATCLPSPLSITLQSRVRTPQNSPGITRTEVGNLVTFKFGSKLPEAESWFQTLAGSELNLLFALISSPTVVQGNSYTDNALRRILVPRTGQKVLVLLLPSFKAIHIWTMLYAASSCLGLDRKF